MEKRDNLFLIGEVIAIILWIKYAHFIPEDYSWPYFLLLAVLLVPFFYLLYLKRQIYQWSWEAVFYLFLLTFVGIIAFSNSILGINPFKFFN